MTEQDVNSMAKMGNRFRGPSWSHEEYDWLAARARERFFVDHDTIDAFTFDDAYEGEGDDLRRELLLACDFLQPTISFREIILDALPLDLTPVLRVLAHVWRGEFLASYGFDEDDVEDAGIPM